MQLHRRVLLKMIESRHMPIRNDLEANLGGGARWDCLILHMGRDYWIGLKISDNETNIAEKIVFEYVHFSRTLPQAIVFWEPERGESPRPFIDSHWPLL